MYGYNIPVAWKLGYTTKGIVKPRTDKQYDIFQMNEFVYLSSYYDKIPGIKEIIISSDCCVITINYKLLNIIALGRFNYIV